MGTWYLVTGDRLELKDSKKVRRDHPITEPRPNPRIVPGPTVSAGGHAHNLSITFSVTTEVLPASWTIVERGGLGYPNLHQTLGAACWGHTAGPEGGRVESLTRDLVVFRVPRLRP